MRQYFYQLYGFHICSELELPEGLMEKQGEKIDIQILKDEMPEEIKNMIEKNQENRNSVATKKDGIWFRIEDVADYLIEKGDKIIVHPLCTNIGQPVRTYLLGSAFGYYFALNRIVAIHGGAVAWKDNGIILTGESGAGKSTVTMGLLKNGFDFIADDVCVLSFCKEGFRVNLAYPQQKLCRDAVRDAGYEEKDLIYIDEKRDKFARRLEDGFRQNGAKLNIIFEIRISEETENIQMEKLYGHEKLKALIHNVFRGESAFQIWGLSPDYMQMCLRIVQEIKIFRIIRPAIGNTTEEIQNRIMNVVEERE